MPSAIHMIAALATMLAVTFMLRALPFAVLKTLRSSALVADVIDFLNRYMPVGILVILVTYSLRDVSLTSAPHGTPEALGLLATAGLHLWKRNLVLSIIGGTAVYVLLVNLVFPA
ncbi:branched-chain amino acid transporter permease [Streptomyces roseoverticillatus]|uniref:branched-chain amino acid transporter permease n=1 Tax=Streptomyces roseoverticillatus TaxID=66429 RepID=UPI0004C1FF29|nr:AzlD domain-containing protein [Streptomyces roseoverticillatus]